MTFEGLINELDCIDNDEARPSERADGALIARGRSSDDCTHVAVNENVVGSKLADYRRP